MTEKAEAPGRGLGSFFLPVVPAPSAGPDQPPGRPQDQEDQGQDEQPLDHEPESEQDRDEKEQQEDEKHETSSSFQWAPIGRGVPTKAGTKTSSVRTIRCGRS
jgi:hypothetical protein